MRGIAYFYALTKLYTHNRNLKTSKALLKSQAHQGTSLFTSATTNQRGGFSKWVVKRSSGPIFRIPGGDRVAVKVGIVQVEKVNDKIVRYNHIHNHNQNLLLFLSAIYTDNIYNR